VSNSQVNPGFTFNVIVKAFILFILVNLIFALFEPLPGLGRISAYNHLFPGRQRLPYSDVPDRSYSLSLYNLNAMFASLELAATSKPSNEFRVILIGDSSTWGFLLRPGETLAAQLNAKGMIAPDGRRFRFYNLGYPVMSVTKDLLILSYAMQYQPDLIIWPITLESLAYDKQLYPPLLQNNPEAVRGLIERYQLRLALNDSHLLDTSFLGETIIGRRRDLADLVRFQLYGVLWAATGVDQDIPATYTLRQEDLSADQGFHNLQPPHLKEDDLALDILQAGIKMSGQVPILFVNEPMFISQGKNSDVRYNFYYPRWAYDDYRLLLSKYSQQQGWNYLDYWNIISANEFTNSAVHLTSYGSAEFAHRLSKAIPVMLDQKASQKP
jgi:hypothetical protein